MTDATAPHFPASALVAHLDRVHPGHRRADRRHGTELPPGVERTMFYFVCVGAVAVFNLFESLLAGVIVFVGGYAFGRWITEADPAMLRILARSEQFRARYDAAKQEVAAVEVR